MSARARRAKVERTGADVSVRRQCALLNVARSGVYRPRPEPDVQSDNYGGRLSTIKLAKLGERRVARRKLRA